MMLSMVKWCLRSPAFLGVLLGAVVTGTYPRVAWGGSSPAPSTPPACQQTWPTEVSEFVTTQCDVHAAIFGSDEEPGVGFAFTKNITRAGIHEGTTWFGETVVLEVIAAVPLTLDRVQNPQIPEGFSAAVVVGRLTGPAGRVGVLGIHMKTAGLTEDPDYVFVVSKILAETDLEVHARAERLAAGARVVNRLTGQSTPLSLVTDGMYASLSMSESDPATLYGDPVAAPGDPGVTVHCVRDAINASIIDRNAAMEKLENCLSICIGAYAVAIAACGASTLLTGPLGVGVGAVCLLAALAIRQLGIASCNEDYRIEMNRINQQFRRQAEYCGVRFLEV